MTNISSNGKAEEHRFDREDAKCKNEETPGAESEESRGVESHKQGHLGFGLRSADTFFNRACKVQTLRRSLKSQNACKLLRKFKVMLINQRKVYASRTTCSAYVGRTGEFNCTGEAGARPVDNLDLLAK